MLFSLVLELMNTYFHTINALEIKNNKGKGIKGIRIRLSFSLYCSMSFRFNIYVKAKYLSETYFSI